MHERGLAVGHITIFRRVQRYAPEVNAAALTNERHLLSSRRNVR